MSRQFHQPVLLSETVAFLAAAREVLDCTLGGGGHATALLKRGVFVTAIDRDAAAVERGRSIFSDHISNGALVIHRGNFSRLDDVVELTGKRFDGILLDLGVSSHQLDAEQRGFTFRPGAPLDMRMGDDAATDAATLLNTATERELEQILHDFADEPRARRLAAELVRRRSKSAFATSDDLVNAIRAVLGPRSGPPDFARIFQGIRIAVNEESSALAEALPSMRDRLKPSGVMVVISYHSGEDRVVKNAFRDWTKGCICPPRQPFCTCGLTPMGEILTKKSVVATDAEQQSNPRSRSARMRAWRKNG